MSYSVKKTSLITFEEIARLEEHAEIPPPVGSIDMEILRPHQREAVLKFRNRNGLLAHQMGLGKTRTALVIIANMFLSGPTYGAAIFVGKLACLDSLVSEVRKLRDCGIFLNLCQFNNMTPAALRTAHVVFITYDTLVSSKTRADAGRHGSSGRISREAEHWLWEGVHPIVVLDEAHEIVNAATQRFSACMALTSERRLAMTGSPIINSADDLTNLRKFLGAQCEALEEYCLVKKREDVMENRGETRPAQLREFYMRTGFHTQEEVSLHQTLLADLARKLCLSGNSNSVVMTEEDDWQDFGDGGEAKEAKKAKNNNTSVFTAIVRARQACLVPALVDQNLLSQKWATTHSTKMNMLMHYLKMYEGSRVVVMTFFRSAIPFITQRMKMEGIETVLQIHGKMKVEERNNVVEQWRSLCKKPKEKTIVLLATTGSSGVSLNIDGADRIVLLEAGFAPARREQIKFRVMRLNTEHDVVATEMILDDTIEECMDVMCREKKSMTNNIMSGKIRLNNETVQRFILKPLEGQRTTQKKEIFDEENGLYFNVETRVSRNREEHAEQTAKEKEFRPMFDFDESEIEAMQTAPETPEVHEIPEREEPKSNKRRKNNTNSEEEEENEEEEKPKKKKKKHNVSERRQQLAELVNYDVDAKGYLREGIRVGKKPIYVKLSPSKDHTVQREFDSSALSSVFLQFRDKEEFCDVVRQVLERDVSVEKKEDYEVLCKEAFKKEKSKGIYLERSKNLLVFCPKKLMQ